MRYDKYIIRDIFYSGIHSFRSDMQPIVDICYLLDTNLLFVKKERACDKKTYLDYIEGLSTGKIDTFDVQGGKEAHMALKLIGRDILNKRGYTDILFESEFEGNIPDVMDSKTTILVECGNSNASKLFKFYINKKIKELMVVPYPDLDRDIYAYTFIPGDELSEFLIFREHEMAKAALKKMSISK
jgi:hypothetical protein